MQVEEKPRASRRRAVTLLVVVSTILFVVLVQRPTPPNVTPQPTSRANAVAGESGQMAMLYLPVVIKPKAEARIAPVPTVVTPISPEQALFVAINARRTQAGCPSFALSSSLEQAARAHSRDMADRNFFSHTGSDGSKPAARAARAGYQFNGEFETITAGQETQEAALAAWMASKLHREILLNCGLDDAGVGFARDTDGNGYRFYWTVSLGAR
jgi:uncharacterized protein YkwD